MFVMLEMKRASPLKRGAQVNLSLTLRLVRLQVTLLRSFSVSRASKQGGGERLKIPAAGLCRLLQVSHSKVQCLKFGLIDDFYMGKNLTYLPQIY